ncbi:UPF0149 family protein [Burkholderia sp. PAMC 26561]|uniref:UPF0149 family protein n=1 Tax=Burkholderia sp. PAMC 26561 TaxID=1795043 RepID=UPI00076B3B81|nr:UPF0149 family protein [Burkholderia sp. PAMC 26561]AME28190.1 hypothetical protein AXG89_30565 [Burkholderia sp. PAMC 26561]
MNDAAPFAPPLSEAEIEELDEFLMSDHVPDSSMDVSMIDGFITALVSGPNLVMPSTMLNWIWDADNGREAPQFSDALEYQRIVGLILRHWNDINDTLNASANDYEPLIMESRWEGRTMPVIDEWCEGYHKGLSIDAAGWTPLLAEHPEWFTAITLYGTESGWDELKARKDSVDQHEAFANSLADSARRIHRYWVEDRKLRIERDEMPVAIGPTGKREPLKRPPKAGRNEACPCGSGKKYKRCHGLLESNEFEATGRKTATFPRSSEGEEPTLIHSPLSQRIERVATGVDLEIYRGSTGGWLLEIVDEFGNSTVWDESFATDVEALAEALNVIDSEGITSVIGSPASTVTRH